MALEGDNQFNTVLLSEQLANIKLHKLGPHIDVGQLEYNFTNNQHTEEAIDSVRFVSNPKVRLRYLNIRLEENMELYLEIYMLLVLTVLIWVVKTLLIRLKTLLISV